jgi:DNA invertase Pin-like site-specific DNA recombinase
METTSNTVQMDIPHEITAQVQAMMEKFQQTKITTSKKMTNPPNLGEVKMVLTHRIRGGKFEYKLVFTEKSVEWVADDSTDCEWLIAQYNKTRKIRTAYVIARVSTEQQAADNTLSLIGQVASIREKVGAGYDRIKIVSIAKSAYKSIPQKIQIVGEAANQGDLIIVYRVDRLSRNLVLSLEWLENLNDRGVEVMAVIDAVTAIDGEADDRCLTYRDNTLTFIQAVLDGQKESKILSNKMKRAIRERQERGDEAIGGLPYGKKYHRSDDGSNRLLVVLDPEAQKVIETIKKLWSDCGTGFFMNTTKLASAVASKLRAKGVRKKNKAWSVQMIRNLIKKI